MTTSPSPRVLAFATTALLALTAVGCGHDWDATYTGAPGAEGAGEGPGTEEGGLTRCGGTDQLAETFDAEGVISADFAPTGSVHIAQGAAVFPFDTLESYNSLSSRRFYNLRNNAIAVEVTKVPDPSTQATAFLNVWYNGDNYAQLVERGGALWFERNIGGTTESLRTVPYDPVAHRHWRLRADGATLYWETSPDGAEWTTQTSSEAPFDLTSVMVQIGGGQSPDDTAPPGEVRFESVNGGGRKTGGWCPASTLTDNFEDGITGHGWMRSFFDPGCEHSEVGELVFTLLQGQVGQCGYMTASAVDLTDDTLTIKAPLIPDASASTQVLFAASLDDHNRLQFLAKAGTLQLDKVVNDATAVLREIPRDPAQHLWWRFRESSGRTSWETSPDGRAWSEQAVIDDPFPVNALDILLKVYRFEGASLPDEVRFDELNLAP